MIIESMTHEERFLELESDFEALLPVILKRKKQEKKRLEKRRFVGKTVLKFEETSPRKNVYSVWIRIDMKHTDKEYMTVVTRMQSHRGTHFFMVKKIFGAIGVMEVTPHVIKRIRERFRGEVEDDPECLVHTLFKDGECVVCAKANDRSIFNDFVAMHDVDRYETLVACFSLGSLIISVQTDSYFLIRTFMDYKMMLGSRNREIFSLTSNIYIRRNPSLFSMNKFKASGFYLKNMDSFYRLKFPPSIIIFPFAPRYTDRPKGISTEDWKLIEAASIIQYMFGTSMKDSVELAQEIKSSHGKFTKTMQNILEKYDYVFIRRADGEVEYYGRYGGTAGMDSKLVREAVNSDRWKLTEGRRFGGSEADE